MTVGGVIRSPADLGQAAHGLAPGLFLGAGQMTPAGRVAADKDKARNPFGMTYRVFDADSCPLRDAEQRKAIK